MNLFQHRLNARIREIRQQYGQLEHSKNMPPMRQDFSVYRRWSGSDTRQVIAWGLSEKDAVILTKALGTKLLSVNEGDQVLLYYEIGRNSK